MLKMSLTMLAVVQLISAAPSGAGPVDVESLRGLKSVEVLVEELNEDAERVSVYRNQLQPIVELQLRKAGIAIEDTAEATLYLNINVTVIPEADVCSYTVSLELWQSSRLIRDPKIIAIGPTWRDASFGVVVRKSPVQNIKRCCSELTDRFSNDYLRANGK